MRELTVPIVCVMTLARVSVCEHDALGAQRGDGRGNRRRRRRGDRRRRRRRSDRRPFSAARRVGISAAAKRAVAVRWRTVVSLSINARGGTIFYDPKSGRRFYENGEPYP